MMPHPFTEFRKYIGTPLQEDIFPIIPVGAKLSANSKLTPEQLGKIPGRYNADTGEWAGFNWPLSEATPRQLERWEDQQATARRHRFGHEDEGTQRPRHRQRRP